MWYSTAVLDHFNLNSLSACFHKATNMATTVTPTTADTETNAKHSANATTQVSLQDMLKEMMKPIELNSCEHWTLSFCLFRSQVRKETGSWKSVWLVYFTWTNGVPHAPCCMAQTWSRPAPFMRDALHRPSPLPSTPAGPGLAETAVSGLRRHACPQWLHSAQRFSPTRSRRRQQTSCWRGLDLMMNSLPWKQLCELFVS